MSARLFPVWSAAGLYLGGGKYVPLTGVQVVGLNSLENLPSTGGMLSKNGWACPRCRSELVTDRVDLLAA